ncbi:MAG: ImmA/IrrE family metallo-endopeptidase [Paludibacteraceae bacterium]|nr:ImmA/IrrE family metallo-endopeptidase [Paludibacteraceae bacterium]
MNKNEFRGEQLKSARLLRAMTITALAELTDISKQSISLYENGENKPEYQRTLALATALRVPTTFFFSEDVCRTETPATYFRSLASATKLTRASQSLKLEYVAKMYEALLEYIDFPALDLPHIEYSGMYDLNDPDSLEAMYQELEAAAMKVREYWGLGDGPIGDLQYILESHGIIVTGFDTTEDDIDAFSQRTILKNDEVCFIAVDQGRKPEGRIRFDMAHELAHLLIHPWSEDIDSLSKEEFKLRETEANVFASAFLLPRSTFGSEVSNYPTELEYYLLLRKKWRTSIQAMMYRARQLGCMSGNQFQYMMRQVSKRGWRKAEPGDSPYMLGDNIFQGAVDLLLDEKILTAEGIRRLFASYGVNLYTDEIESLLHIRKDTLASDEPQAKIIQLKTPRNNVAPEVARNSHADT